MKPSFYAILLGILMVFAPTFLYGQHDRSAEEMRLRYGVRSGDRFEMKITMRGKITSQTPSGTINQKDMLYEIAAVQTIEQGSTEETFSVRIQVLPVRTRLLVDGKPLTLGRDALPAITIKMNRLGEVKEIVYRNFDRRATPNAETVEMSGLFASLPLLPADQVKKGARWPLMPETSSEDFHGEAVLIGLERYKGRQCARMQIQTNKRLAPAKELENTFNARGLRFEGHVKNDSELFFALTPGWPMFGKGETTYETVMKQGENVMCITRYELNSNFEVTIP